MTTEKHSAAQRLRAETPELVKLSIPLMIGLAAPMLIGVIDTIMIAPLGTLPLAAAGLTTSVLIILLATIWGLVTMTNVRIAQAEGAEDRKGVAVELRTGLILTLAAAALASLLMIAWLPGLRLLGQPAEVLAVLPSYWIAMALWLVPFALFFVLKGFFDAIGRPWTGVALSYLGVAVNIPLNWALIYPAGLGLLGAGLASILSQSVALLAAWLVWQRTRALSPWRIAARMERETLRAQVRDGWPLMLGYAGEGGSYALIGVMIGWIGTQALAANQIVHTVSSVAYVFPLGMAVAASIRTGLAVGAGAHSRLRPLLGAALMVVTVWMVLLMIVFLLGGRTLGAWLSEDPDVISLAATLFIAVAFMQVADGIQSTTLGALRGIGDMRVPTVISLIAYWPLALPTAYVLGFVFEWGAVGVWVGFGLGIGVAAVLLPLRFLARTREQPMGH